MTCEIVSLTAYRAAKGGHELTLAKLANGAKLDGRKRPGDLTFLNDARSEPRQRMHGRCVLSLTLAGRPARLVNVSRNGLMAAADLRHKPGTRMLVSVSESNELSGRLIWKRGGLVGVEVPVDTISMRVI